MKNQILMNELKKAPSDADVKVSSCLTLRQIANCKKELCEDGKKRYDVGGTVEDILYDDKGNNVFLYLD